MPFYFWLYFIILYVSSGYGIFHFRKMPAWLNTVTLICLFTAISESVARILEHTIGNSCPSYHVYVIICYIFQCFAYIKKYKDNGFIRSFGILSTTVLTTFSITNSIFIQQPLTFPSHAILLSNILMLVLILYSFLLMLKTPGKGPLYKEAFFWFNAANLLLNTCLFFYFAFYNILIASASIPDEFENVIVVFTILAYLLYGTTLYLGNKKTSIPYDSQ